MITLQNETKARELLSQTDLDWKVEKRQLSFLNDDFTRGESSHYALVRDDTNAELGIAKGGYTPVQNLELMDLLITYFADSNLNLGESIKTRSLKGGEQVVIEIPVKEFDVPGAKRGDTIRQSAIIKDFKNGHGSMMVGFGDVILSCTNGMVTFKKKGRIRFRHTQNIEYKLKNFDKLWNAAIDELEVRRSVYHRFALKQVNAADVDRVIAASLNFDSKELEEQSTRKLNEFEAITECVENEMKEKGRTAWGLYNGITYWTNHELGNAEQEERVAQLYHAKPYRVNQRALAATEELVAS